MQSLGLRIKLECPRGGNFRTYIGDIEENLSHVVTPAEKSSEENCPRNYLSLQTFVLSRWGEDKRERDVGRGWIQREMRCK